MSVQIDKVHTELEVQPSGSTRPGASSGMNGLDRTMLERLRPLVLQILTEELDRLRRQHG